MKDLKLLSTIFIFDFILLSRALENFIFKVLY